MRLRETRDRGDSREIGSCGGGAVGGNLAATPESPPEAQEALPEALATEGWEVTQSSVSRNITALRLVKVDGAYRRPPRGSVSQDPNERRIAVGVLTCEPAGDALIVLHTPPCEANRMAVALGRVAWPDIVRAIAGDDTIFLAVKETVTQRRVMREIRRLVSI